TDAAGVDGLNAAIERSQLFMAGGARKGQTKGGCAIKENKGGTPPGAGPHMAKPMGVDAIEDIRRVIREVPGPHMATLSQAAGPKRRSLEDLEAAGVVAATFPSLALFAAGQA